MKYPQTYRNVNIGLAVLSTFFLALLLNFRRHESTTFFETDFECQHPKKLFSENRYCTSEPRQILKNQGKIAVFTVNGRGVFRYSQIKNASYFDVSVGSIYFEEERKSNNFGKLMVLASGMLNFDCVVYIDRDIQVLDEHRITRNCASRNNVIARSGGTHYISIADRQRFLGAAKQILKEGKGKYDETYINEHKEWFEWDEGDVTSTIMCYRYVARRRQCVHGVKHARKIKAVALSLAIFLLILQRNFWIHKRSIYTLNIIERLAIFTGLDITLLELVLISLCNLVLELRIDVRNMRQVITRDGRFLLPVEHADYNYFLFKKANLFFSTDSFAASLEIAFFSILLSKILVNVVKKLTGLHILESKDILRVSKGDNIQQH